MRTPTPKAARLAALVAADWTCQAPGCGRTAAQLARLRDRLLRLAARWNTRLTGYRWVGTVGRPVKVWGLVTRYKIVPDATLLEVDHIVEQADGGTHGLSNLQVLCVFCHEAKTRARIGKRARAPVKESASLPMASASLLERSAKTTPAGRMERPAAKAPENRWDRNVHQTQQSRLAPPRRHVSEAEFLAAARRREAAIGNQEEAC